MDTQTLLLPISSVIQSYNTKLVQQARDKQQRFRAEIEKLEAELKELYSFNPTQHILSDGERSKLTTVPLKIEHNEATIHTLNICIDSLNQTVAQIEIPLRKLKSEISKFTGACLRGREQLLKLKAEGKVNPIEQSTFRSNLNGLKRAIANVERTLGQNGLGEEIIKQLLAIEPINLEEVA